MMWKQRNNETVDGMIATARRFLIPLFIFSIVINLLTLIIPIYLLQIYDRVLTSRNVTTLLLLTILALSMLAVCSLIAHYRAVVAARLGVHLQQGLSRLVFGVVIKKRTDVRVSRHLIRNIERIHSFVAGGSLTDLFDALWTPIFLAMLFLLHPMVGLVASAFVVAFMILGILKIWTTDERTKNSKEAKAKADQFLKTCLDADDIIWSMGMARPIVEDWQERRTEVLEEQAYVSDQKSGYKAARRFLQQAGQLSVIGTGAYLAIIGHITPGAIVAGSIICIRTLQPIDGTIRALNEMRAMKEAYPVLQRFVGARNSTKGSGIFVSSTGIFQVEDLAINLGKGKQPQSVRGIEFNLDVGECLSVVGPTGTGKSLLAQTLAGVRQPAAGSVTLNGVDLHRIAPDRLGALIGYVSQRPALFDGTIGQNITRFRDGASEELDLAVDRAGLREILLSLPDAYDTPMTEAAKALSPIHIRFITLARALYGTPPLLIIDQIDAGLDKARIEVLHDIIKMSRSYGQTTVWITDKSQMVQRTNYILVLSESKVEFLRNVSQPKP